MRTIGRTQASVGSSGSRICTIKWLVRLGGRDLGSSGFTLGGIATFFAVGCSICNKIVLLALGTSGALNVYAPIQPLIGMASLVILAATVRWSLRRRAQGCAVRPAAP